MEFVVCVGGECLGKVACYTYRYSANDRWKMERVYIVPALKKGSKVTRWWCGVLVSTSDYGSESPGCESD